jgi:hypothetical protein
MRNVWLHYTDFDEKIARRQWLEIFYVELNQNQ